jgi:hypothetical protein
MLVHFALVVQEKETAEAGQRGFGTVVAVACSTSILLAVQHLAVHALNALDRTLKQQILQRKPTRPKIFGATAARWRSTLLRFFKYAQAAATILHDMLSKRIRRSDITFLTSNSCFRTRHVMYERLATPSWLPFAEPLVSISSCI